MQIHRALLVPVLLAAGAFSAGCSTVAPTHTAPAQDVRVEGVSGATSLDEALRRAGDAQLVCFGESHDDRAHHELQLEVLRAMADASDAPLMVGMEMFQRPYQQHLDDYVAGRIDEREMLRRTEYFGRWNFDYTLYAPLWRFCRERGIRVVGLNAPRDVVRQIGRQGLDSLDDTQRALIASEIDLTIPSHKERIMGVFSGGIHPMPPERLARMYEAQTTWDETMAESAALALEAAGPDARMLVLAGSYHIQEFDGIPLRIQRRLPHLDPLVIVARSEGRWPEEGVIVAQLGHYVVVPVDERPRLGVAFAPDSLEVASVAPGGAAAAAGVETGDRIVAISGTDVADLVDVRYVLDPLRLGSEGTITVERNGTRTTMSTRWIPTPQPSTRMPAR